MKVNDKESLKRWQGYVREFRKSRNIDLFETPEAKKERIALLMGDFYAFAKYYFPNVCKSDFAPWHYRYAEYLIENDRAFAAIKVSRDMAKSALTAMLLVYLYYKREYKVLGYFSHIQDQAAMLLNAVKISFEKNEALIRDFGNQKGTLWTNNRFTTVTGASFRAVGAGQNPRGEKNEDADRFDFLVFDDFDDPEVCRNPERLDYNWKYVLGDCFPALHVSGKRRIVFLNNKIDEDCIIERAFLHAANIKNSLTITVNLIDNAGHSNWPEAYTDEECAEMIALAEEEAETEYMNNPSAKGKQFQADWFQFAKLPPLNKYKLLVAYLDGGFKKTKTADTKALVLVGIMEGFYHVRKVYVDNTSIEGMIDWHYDLDTWLKTQNATAMWYMEEVFLLSLLHDHFDAAVGRYGFRIPMLGDKRKKPDKDLRISNTAGYYERGRVIFCESLRNDRFMKRLKNQYLRFRKGLTNIEKDGPDAIEGAFTLLNEMTAASRGSIKTGTFSTAKHRI